MFEILSLGSTYFLFKKLYESGVKKIYRNLLILWALFCAVTGYIASYDYGHAEINIFPGRLTEILRAVNLTWTIIILLSFFCFLLVYVLSGFRKFNAFMIKISLILSLFASIYCFLEAYFVNPKFIAITTNKLPDNIEKLRIAFVTDAHIGGLSTHWHFSRIMKIVDDSKPDIILLGGDIIDGLMEYREREKNILKESAKNAKYGAFAVNGNHEYYWLLDQDVEGIIQECGYKLLIDERIETSGIVILGLNDVNYGVIKPMIKHEDEKKFVVILKHRPGIPFDAENKFDLQLSGHTHGGQFWPLGYFKNKELNSTQGLSRKSGGYVYVSNGAGFNGAMMRMFVPPEVTIIDILREKNK